MPKLLIAGLPRSGTSWVSSVIGMCADCEMVFEPDNEKTSLLAVMWKRDVPRFPTLEVRGRPESYARLWRYAFDGRWARLLSRSRATVPLRLLEGRLEAWIKRKEGRCRGPDAAFPFGKPESLESPAHRPRRRRRVVKSVHIPFCVDWVVREAAVDQVLVVLRDPLATIASMRRMGMADGFRPGSLGPHLASGEAEIVRQGASGTADLKLLALQVLKMRQSLLDRCSRHPEWLVVHHEDLCRSPVERFREMFDQLRLPWSSRVEERVRGMDREGTGYRTHRRAQDEIGKWRRELGGEDLRAIEEIQTLVT